MAIRSVEYLQSLVRELAKLPNETEWVEFKCNNKQPQMIMVISNTIKETTTMKQSTRNSAPEIFIVEYFLIDRKSVV